jgi:hypothetical protein
MFWHMSCSKRGDLSGKRWAVSSLLPNELCRGGNHPIQSTWNRHTGRGEAEIRYPVNAVFLLDSGYPPTADSGMTDLKASLRGLRKETKIPTKAAQQWLIFAWSASELGLWTSQRTMSVVVYVENVLPHTFTLNRWKLGMKLVLANQHCVLMPRAANIVNGV